MANTGRHNYDYAEAARRRARAAELYLKHTDGATIAAELGVTRARVSQYVTQVQHEWRASAVRDWDALKEQELQRLNLLEKTYWAGWERSLQDAETNISESGERPIRYEGQDGRLKVQSFAYARAVVKREGQGGDPRFLDGIGWCIERRCKMFGLDAPKVIDIEMRVREAALSEGLDPDAAVEEARYLLGTYGMKAQKP